MIPQDGWLQESKDGHRGGPEEPRGATGFQRQEKLGDSLWDRRRKGLAASLFSRALVGIQRVVGALEQLLR